MVLYLHLTKKEKYFRKEIDYVYFKKINYYSKELFYENY